MKPKSLWARHPFAITRLLIHLWALALADRLEFHWGIRLFKYRALACRCDDGECDTHAL